MRGTRGGGTAALFPPVAHPSLQGPGPRRQCRAGGGRDPYQSNKTGRSEVYVRPLPVAGTGEIAVTAEGGTRPVWARDGSELYYWTASRTSVAIKAIRITPGPPSSWGAPSVVVEGAYATTSWDTDTTCGRAASCS